MTSLASDQPDALREMLENQIQLRKDLIQEFIQREFEGNRAAFGRSLELQDLPHRKTILRWASEEDLSLPKGAKRLLALAQALDVDPFMLLDIDLALLMECCRKASWNLAWGTVHKALAFLNELFRLTEEDWPPPEIAELFDGEWYTAHLEHNPRQGRNYFQPLKIQSDLLYGEDGAIKGPRNPQLWYLAYREVSFGAGVLEPRSFWRPYAIVYLYQNELVLLHLAGLLERVALPSGNTGQFVLETFFGQGAAQFRLASLHPFETESLVAGESLADLPRLRCDFPE
jgi:hypothetical protein